MTKTKFVNTDVLFGTDYKKLYRELEQTTAQNERMGRMYWAHDKADRRKDPLGVAFLFTLGCGGGSMNSGKRSNNPPGKSTGTKKPSTGSKKTPPPGPRRPKDPRRKGFASFCKGAKP
jgi:hypothetical protein